MRKITVIILSSISLLSCNFSNKEKVSIYYFNNDFNSPTSVDCYEMLNQLDLIMVETNNNELINTLKQSLKNAKQGVIEIDARYKVILKTDTICIDRFGGFTSNYKNGEIKNFILFKEYLKNYTGTKIKVTEAIEDYIKIEDETIK